MPHEDQQGCRFGSTLARYLVLSYCFILLVATLRAAPAVAAGVEIDSLALLKSRNYSELERHYSTKQQAYEAGSISEETLYGDFRTLYQDDPSNEQYFSGWVTAFPKSYSARMARGAYYYRMGWFVRGTQYIAQTRPEQLDQMASYLDKARTDLYASLEMTRKPYLTTLYLVNVSMLAGNGKERRQWLDMGTGLDPKNLLLRSRYMVTLQPRWGGSHEQMLEFLQECTEQKLPQRTLARLELIVRRDIADMAKDAEPSVRYDVWDQVLRAEQASGQPPSVEAVMRRTRAAWDLNKRDEANLGLEQLTRMNVEEGWALSQMAWMYARQGQHDKGWPYLVKAANKRDPWAQLAMGMTIYRGAPNLGVAADQNAGLVWIRRSAEQGNSEAQNFLKSVN